MGNDRTRDLAHRLREALGKHSSDDTESTLRELLRDEVARCEIFIRLGGERDALLRLWENFGPGPRITHHPGPGFQARVRWNDQETSLRRGAVRAALATEFRDAPVATLPVPFVAIKKAAAASRLGMLPCSFSRLLRDVKAGRFPAWAHGLETEVRDLLQENSVGQLDGDRITRLSRLKAQRLPTKA